jgi:hypothetical protein
MEEDLYALVVTKMNRLGVKIFKISEYSKMKLLILQAVK